jgi:hypothetical protein
MLGWGLCIVLIILLIFTPIRVGGFWLASEQFRQEAGLDSLLIYFGGGGYSRDGYLSLKANGTTIYNDRVQFRIEPALFGPPTLLIKWKTPCDAIPSRLLLELNGQSMVLRCPETSTVYAHLFRDAEMSSNVAIGDNIDSP